MCTCGACAGILKYLSEQFDLTKMHMIGSSAGGLLSVLAACQVDPREAVQRAHDLCVSHGVFDRPLGLAGIWGKLVRQWLEELLPDDAADKCNGNVTILVTELPFLSTKSISHFKVTDLYNHCLYAHPTVCQVP